MSRYSLCDLRESFTRIASQDRTRSRPELTSLAQVHRTLQLEIRRRIMTITEPFRELGETRRRCRGNPGDL